jgi:N-acetylglucosaminyl-diphospho-decaprenol L-rhamnosyltransferase
VTRLSVVVVAHNSAGALEQTLPRLLPELVDGDEVIVVDNASADGTPGVVKRLAPDARLVETGANLGFAAGANRGAEAAQGDLLVLLNPDAVPLPGFGEAIRRPLADGRGWDAWMGLVTMDGGRTVNTAGGVVHFTGIAWAGEVGRPVHDAERHREVTLASGACLAMPLDGWRDAGGMPPEFFLYHEDVDLALRILLRGGRIGLEPTARVDHDYAFHKGGYKWRMLERNRWAAIVRTYPGPLLVVLMPALLATELALVVVAVRGGWASEKLRAATDVARWLPRLLRERREIQARRTISSLEFAAWLTPDLSSPYLGSASDSGVLRVLLRAYWRGVRAILRALPG